MCQYNLHEVSVTHDIKFKADYSSLATPLLQRVGYRFVTSLLLGITDVVDLLVVERDFEASRPADFVIASRRVVTLEFLIVLCVIVGNDLCHQFTLEIDSLTPTSGFLSRTSEGFF